MPKLITLHYFKTSLNGNNTVSLTCIVPQMSNSGLSLSYTLYTLGLHKLGEQEKMLIIFHLRFCDRHMESKCEKQMPYFNL